MRDPNKKTITIEDDMKFENGEKKQIKDTKETFTKLGVGAMLSCLGHIKMDTDFIEYPWVEECRNLCISLYENLYDFYKFFESNYNVLCKR